MSFTPQHDIKILRSLPVHMSRDIGRAIVSWSYYETLIQRTIYDILDLPVALGRLAVVEKRGQDQIDLIISLCQYHEIQVDKAQAKDLRLRTTHLKSIRDLLAHGNWHKDDRSYFVTVTRGQWNKQEMPELEKVSRKIIPLGARFDRSNLSECHKEIDRLIEDFGDFRTSIAEQLEALLKKSP